MVNSLIGDSTIFFTNANFVALSFVSLLCIVAMNACKFIIMHVRLVFEGGLANLYDMVWTTCMHGTRVWCLLWCSQLLVNQPCCPPFKILV